MNVGVIGSGSIGPDLAYGFVSALAKKRDGRAFLLDIKKEALDSGKERIRGYVGKGLARGKLHPKVAKAMEACLVPTMDINDLAGCDYVLEAATEDLSVKQAILRDLERVVRDDCLIGFATSGIPRSRIAANAEHPERCFVNHPFFPAWRSLPIEVVLSENDVASKRMLRTLRALGKVPVITADVPCFAADDIFCNYCAEAARLFEEGTATPAQVDAIVNEAVGGGGPFNVMDLTRGNLLNIHCLELMKEAPTGSEWFRPPPIFAKQANTPWHDSKNPGDPTYDEALKKEVLDRILAVLLARTYFVVDNGVCDASDLNWMTRTALGFREGLLDVAEKLGSRRVHEICTSYAKRFQGFHVPASITEKRLPEFYRNLDIARDGEIAVVTIRRPEVMNALDDKTMSELRHAFDHLDGDDSVEGIVLTGFGGSLAGADIMELAVLKTPEEAEAKCHRGHEVLARISGSGRPVVAALDGPVLGGGAELSMACHARVVGRGLTMGQPEVNLGIIPGYGGTQRLPRLVGVERALDLLRTGRPVGAAEACEWGWAHGEPVGDPVASAKELIRAHLSGESRVAPVNPDPLTLPQELPNVEIGHHSRTIDTILVRVVRRGCVLPLDQGLRIEAHGFGRCQLTVDYDIGMKNFIQNGPRVPADFLHE